MTQLNYIKLPTQAAMCINVDWRKAACLHTHLASLLRSHLQTLLPSWQCPEGGIGPKLPHFQGTGEVAHKHFLRHITYVLAPVFTSDYFSLKVHVAQTHMVLTTSQPTPHSYTKYDIYYVTYYLELRNTITIYSASHFFTNHG